MEAYEEMLQVVQYPPSDMATDLWPDKCQSTKTDFILLEQKKDDVKGKCGDTNYRENVV